jgi:A/G-specific adenine glycosylase
MPDDQFSDLLLTWFDRHGRHDLPWQFDRSPYRVWISEIMLQQTQVVTAVKYFNRFIENFPDVTTLSKAKQDYVLHHWTGLGYYARARNLHKTAKIIDEQYDGKLPLDLNSLINLPGIGRSTAGAILSLACEQRHPILDGNVKRVLSRYHGVEGWPGKKDVEATLWSYAELHTPTELIGSYTQAIMDLGATLCIRRNPDCQHCPLSHDCVALKTGREHELPESKPRSNLSTRETIFAIIENNSGEILLEQRPSTGIWGSLWCFPEFSTDKSIETSLLEKYGYKLKDKIEFKTFKHTFSHFHLSIKPVHIKLKTQTNRTNDARLSTWVKLEADHQLGFPAPVVSILKDLNNSKRVVLDES